MEGLDVDLPPLMRRLLELGQPRPKTPDAIFCPYCNPITNPPRSPTKGIMRPIARRERTSVWRCETCQRVLRLEERRD